MDNLRATRFTFQKYLDAGLYRSTIYS